ncbi:MAG: hypothetical protein QXG36_02260 [Nitrososphaeria archaeon]
MPREAGILRLRNLVEENITSTTIVKRYGRVRKKSVGITLNPIDWKVAFSVPTRPKKYEPKKAYKGFQD